MNAEWAQISQRLQQTLDAGTFKVWIAPLTAQSGSGSLRLIAPNAFVANWISDRLAATIAATAEAVLGHPVVLRIEAAATAPRRAPRPAPAPSAVPAMAVPTMAVPTMAVPTMTASAQGAAMSASGAFAAPKAEQLGFPLRAPATPHAWRYNFDSFVIGPCNDLAFAAAKNIARDTNSVSTLFVSSGPGLGKTHLAQAVGAALCNACNHAAPRIEYLTAEQFAGSFVQAAKARDFDHFKWRFHEADALLLEDVHLLKGMEKMQVELLSAIKSLQERGKRVVLTSSFSPRELSGVDSGLVSRFSSGFLAGLEKPDFATRRRILFDKARARQAALSDDVADVLAERLTGDVRQLESCLHSLLLRAQLNGSAADVDTALDVVAQYAAASPFFNLDSITHRVCEAFGLTSAQLCTRSRKSDYVLARNTVFYLARRHTDLSLEAIGEHFARRHSTVIKGISAVERELSRETVVGRQLADTLSRIEKRCS